MHRICGQTIYLKTKSDKKNISSSIKQCFTVAKYFAPSAMVRSGHFAVIIFC